MYDLVKLSEETRDIDIVSCGKFYRLTRLVLNREENFLDKLTTIVNVISSIGCSLATVVRSDGYQIDYYIGIISKKVRGDSDAERRQRQANAAAFHGALAGNLIGSDLRELSDNEVEHFRKDVLADEHNCYASVSGVVSLRDAAASGAVGYVQGIENLTDSMRGQKYAIVMIADPLDVSEIETCRQGYELLYTQLTPFAGSSVSINESDTVSLSKARMDGIADGISKGVAMTQSRTNSTGNYFGGSVGMGVGVPGIFSVNMGVNSGMNRGTAQTDGRSDTYTRNTSRNRSVTDTVSSAKTEGKNLQISYENRSVRTLLEKINCQLERLEHCENYGAFDCAAYVIAEDSETALGVAGNYNALMRGRKSSVQASHINVWFRPEKTRILAGYLGSLVHPMFDGEDSVKVSPASVIGGDELAIQIGLPKKSVAGITVVPMAPFGRNLPKDGTRSLELGNLYHMGHDEGENGRKQKARIDIESLRMHTFITGSTGAGKSTAIYAMLDKLMEEKIAGRKDKITFLVIEPAKGEYKDRFGSYPDVKVYGTNYKKMPLLRIDPFSFPDDVHVLEHIDRLIEIFNVCWPMYAAMSAVLKDAVERAYIVSGWNLETSECRYRDFGGRVLYPTFQDVLRQITVVMEESAYSADSKGDYKGALCTRIKSLTNGLYRQIFTNDELPPEELFDRNVIVDLSRTGSAETRSLIMGLLVMKLQEYRMANAVGGNAPLKHITVLEEAHHILKRTSTEQVSEGANLQGKSVELLANSIAEMRTYGEGFIIADQAPGLMDQSVIRNTNTKIILRLPDLADRELVGRAASLHTDQIQELSRLKTFVAAVYQNDWLEPVLCNIDRNFKKMPLFKYEPSEPLPGISGETEKVIEYLLLPIEKRNRLDDQYVSALIREVFVCRIPAEAKAAFVRYTGAETKDEIQKLRGQILYQFFNAETAFGLAKGREKNIEEWYHCICEILEPDIGKLPELARKQIVAAIAMEKARLDESEAAKDLCGRLMDFM